MSLLNLIQGQRVYTQQIQHDLSASNVMVNCDPRLKGPKNSVLDMKSKAGKIGVEDDICDLTVANLTVKGTLTADISGLPTATTYGQYLFYNSNSSNWEVGGEKIHIGNGAGENGQAVDTVALGPDAASTSQGQGAIAIGHDAANTSQGPDAVAIGNKAANNGGQGTEAIAIGKEAAATAQGDKAIAIGSEAGKNQADNCIAIGANAGLTNQAENAIAIGTSAALTIQAENAIAIGTNAATSQESGAIAIGESAGNTAQGAGAIAIGTNAGTGGQDSNAIAIGTNAGQTTSEANSLILNSSGFAVDSNGANSFIVTARGLATVAGNNGGLTTEVNAGATNVTQPGVGSDFKHYLVYNTLTGEIRACPF